MADQEFVVGDSVQIVLTPYKKCKFSWVSNINKYCGLDAVITKVSWHDDVECYAYCIDIDRESFYWCSGCFVAGGSVEIPESDMAVNYLFDK